MVHTLFLSRKWPPKIGGMETYSYELVRALKNRSDVGLEVVTLKERSKGRWPITGQFALFILRASLKLVMHGRRYDAILFGDLLLTPLSWIACMAAPQSRRVVATHGTDVTFDQLKGVLPSIYRNVLRALRVWPSTFHGTVANSKATAEQAYRIGLRNIVVVPLGVRRVTRAGPVRVPYRYVLYVGRIEPQKGAGWFVRQVLPQLPSDLRFIAVGPVWDEAEAEAILASAKAELRSPTFGCELSELRRHALAVVVPNIATRERNFEGFGLTAVEAVADGGVPIVAARQGLHDAIEDGVTGFIVPSGVASVWATKVAEIDAWSPEERDAWIRNAIQRVQKGFTWERVAADTVAVLKGDTSLKAHKKQRYSDVSRFKRARVLRNGRRRGAAIGPRRRHRR